MSQQNNQGSRKLAVDSVQFPSAGCVVEFMQGNKAVQAWVQSEQSGQLHLYTVNKRESKLATNRLLPWLGPLYSAFLSRQEISAILEEHKHKREHLTSDEMLEQVWELTQGEVNQAEPLWFAEVLWAEPTVDQVAGLGQAMLADKIHFKFSPPFFEPYTAEMVQNRLAKYQEEEKLKEFNFVGAELFRKLMEAARQKKVLKAVEISGDAQILSELKTMLLERIANPNLHDNNELWKSLTKDLSSKSTIADDPHLAFILAVAWGILPEHYNFWLDRADYEGGRLWEAALEADIAEIAAKFTQKEEQELQKLAANPQAGLNWFSIDPATTQDWDDAFAITKHASGYTLYVAIATPSLFWNFGSSLDKVVLRRASSLYLPEAEHFMLPTKLWQDLYRLQAEALRPALILQIELNVQGEFIALTPQVNWITVKRNLSLQEAEQALDGESTENKQVFQEELQMAYELAQSLQKKRIADGAIITERQNLHFSLTEDAEGTVLELELEGDLIRAQCIVSEFMVLGNATLASWAVEKQLPLIFRTQDVVIPREFAGVWKREEDIARVVKALPPSSYALTPKNHGGLACKIYAGFSAPMRRYVDLINCAQVSYYLEQQAVLFSLKDLEAQLPLITMHLDAVMQAQRVRPRYWKLFYAQQTELKNRAKRNYWEAVITEELPNTLSLVIPKLQLNLRASKSMLDKVSIGAQVLVRLGKINPLRNEIQVMEILEN